MGICFWVLEVENLAHKMHALFGCNIESTMFSPTEVVQSVKHYALMMPYVCSTSKHMW
jgi:hypothetical protein